MPEEEPASVPIDQFEKQTHTQTANVNLVPDNK